MDNKDDKETIPKEKYVAFHRERQEPIDCYSRSEIDKKLKTLQESFNKKLQEQKDELEKSHKEDIEKLKDQFDKILKKISDTFKEYYTQEKVDQFLNVLTSGNERIDWSLKELDRHHVKLEKVVLKYLETNDFGETVGNTFVFNEPKKKGFWKK